MTFVLLNHIKQNSMRQVLNAVALSFLFFLPSLVIAQKVTKKVSHSHVVWKAFKVTGSHEGTIDLKSGGLSFHDEVLEGGQFTLDMTTISCTDLTGEYKGKLDGHLMSADFFDVENHLVADLIIRSTKMVSKNSYEIKADLTIKDITKMVEFKASIYGNKATANLKVDRTEFDIQYASNSFFDNLKDKAIYDEFDLVIDLEFK